MTTRINVREGDVVAGHFDYDAAQQWTDRDPGTGDGNRGRGRGEAILLTAQGRWVLERWSDWQNEAAEYQYVTPERARAWLLANDFDAVVEEHFGPVEPERGPGRPEIGPSIHVRLPTDLIGRVDEYRQSEGINRAEAIRRLVAVGLDH